ncbi:transducin-like enhancer protein 3-B [Nephila pilipes]|uniref:Transducin-like enhancer protein 3-B n=1 Tax=Nephila pilipes TaxID=299642 RepID=A0A8X6PHA0_NEPPI|nr:transducin-like enhancer protein 3-B [Nephila pilipes]
MLRIRDGGWKKTHFPAESNLQRRGSLFYSSSVLVVTSSIGGMRGELAWTEIAKRLNAIIAQIIPFLSQEGNGMGSSFSRAPHQQQVAAAVERAKQVTMTELNAIVGQQHPGIAHLMQQMHAQQLPPHAHAPPLPMMPHAAAIAGLQPPTLPPSSAAGLLALSNSLAGPAAHLSAAAAASTASSSSSSSIKDHRDEKRNSNSVNDDRQNSFF